MESEALKVVQYTEKNSALAHELNQVRMKLQYAEEQNEKNSSILKEKISGMESHARENERKIEDLKTKGQMEMEYYYTLIFVSILKGTI